MLRKKKVTLHVSHTGNQTPITNSAERMNDVIVSIVHSGTWKDNVDLAVPNGTVC